MPSKGGIILGLNAHEGYSGRQLTLKTVGDLAPPDTPHMTVTSKLKEKLLQELGLRFGTFGFSRWSDNFYGDKYFRQIPGRRQSIAPPIYLRDGCIELDSPSIGLRLDAVEDLVAQFEDPHPLVTPTDIEARATIGTRLEPKGFLAVFRKSWILVEEDDAVKTAEDFVPRVIRKALPFWKRFSDQAEVFDVLSGDLEQAREYAGPDSTIATRAIALAIVLYGKDKARETANKRLSALQGEAKEEVSRWVARALGAMKETTTESK